jgi:hypothetical protein
MKNMFSKTLVFAVIVLFVGASVEYGTYSENTGLLDTISFDKGLHSNSDTPE